MNAGRKDKEVIKADMQSSIKQIIKKERPEGKDREEIKQFTIGKTSTVLFLILHLENMTSLIRLELSMF